MSGVSTLRPAPRSMVSRATVAWAQVSGLAEPTGLLLVTPSEAVVGSVPNGDGGTLGSSHTCSGSRPCPEVMLSMAPSSDRAEPVCPAVRSYSARSPLSTGHRWPEPVSVGAHGAPVGEQVVASGTKQSP